MWSIDPFIYKENTDCCKEAVDIINYCLYTYIIYAPAEAFELNPIRICIGS